jgi:hypothetical protein
MEVNGHIQFRLNRLIANLAIIVLMGKWTVADANKKAAEAASFILPLSSSVDQECRRRLSLAACSRGNL